MNARRMAGFTLIEMMIVVGVIGILAAVAYPSYTEYRIKSRRADCKAVMLTAASALERRFSIDNRYPLEGDTEAEPVPIADPLAGFSCPLSDDPANYDLAYEVADDRASFTLTATPTAIQAADSCGTLTLTNTGARSASGTGSCW